MADVKAIIGLTRGRVAYFEPKSNIMIDLSNPIAYVYDGTDVSELRKAIGGSIYLIQGTLADEPKVEAKAAAKVESVVEEQTAKTEVAEVKAEEVVNKTEEVVAEKPATKKKTTKK